MRALHWFRSDLRLEDNQSLALACRSADEIFPTFIIDRRLISYSTAHPRAEYMFDALRSLNEDLQQQGSRLILLCGLPETLLPEFCQRLGVSLVTFGRDYSPFAKSRDRVVTKHLSKSKIKVESVKDRVVLEHQEVTKTDGTSFRIFTPYKQRWHRQYKQLATETPGSIKIKQCPIVEDFDLIDLKTLSTRGKVELPKANTAIAKANLVSFLDGHVANYKYDRNRLDIDRTSRLSPYLRFGVLSIRTCIENAENAKVDHPEALEHIDSWLNQLIWREFYHAILDAFPHVANFAFQGKYDNVQYDNNESWFEAWCSGQTGFPIVDAAMRQLNESGWIHNRSRMIVASFLTKDLLIDWRWGERYFMNRLIDGDPANNNGGWQWAAGTGTDAQPYFRIFNPTLQGEKFDPHGNYVKRWLPELRNVPSKIIHRTDLPHKLTKDYPKPIVNHKERRVVAIERYKEALQNLSQ